MKLTEQTVKDFAALLASDAPAPGGGSAAALDGALGAGLAAMVCRLTAEKKAFAAYRETLLDIQQQADALRERLLALMDQDTEAFLLVSNAFAMPKGTEEEKAARSAAIQRGLAQCTETPLAVMELSAAALEWAAPLSEHFNESAASDLGVAVLHLRSAIQGAWLNVRINIASLKDRELADRYRAKGEAILERTLPLADRMTKQIEQKI